MVGGLAGCCCPLGEVRTHTIRFLRPFPLPVGIRAAGPLDEIRTRTGQFLRLLPLPVGLQAAVFLIIQ